MKKKLQELLDEPLKKKGGTQKMKSQMGIRNSYDSVGSKKESLWKTFDED